MRDWQDEISTMRAESEAAMELFTATVRIVTQVFDRAAFFVDEFLEDQRVSENQETQ